MPFDFVVGGPRSYFADDKTATCHYCCGNVFFRPHSPLPLIGYLCSTCARTEMTKTGIEVVTTTETLREVAQWLRRN